MLAARLAAMAAARGGEVLRADALLGRGLVYYSPSSLRTTWVANATSNSSTRVMTFSILTAPQSESFTFPIVADGRLCTSPKRLRHSHDKTGRFLHGSTADPCRNPARITRRRAGRAQQGQNKPAVCDSIVHAPEPACMTWLDPRRAQTIRRYAGDHYHPRHCSNSPHHVRIESHHVCT